MNSSQCIRLRSLLLLATVVAIYVPAVRADAAEPTTDLDTRALHFVLVGDSTVTDGAGWGGAFAKLLRPEVRCTNMSGGGESTKSYLARDRWQKSLALKPTHVLIQFGHNDQPGKGPLRETDPATTYRANLTRFIDEARAAGAEPIVVTSLTRRIFENGVLTDTLGPYAEAARAVAAEKRVSLVDLYARSTAIVECLGDVDSRKLGPIRNDEIDRAHLNELGARITARVIVNELRKLAPELGDCFGDEGKTIRLLTVGNSFSRNAVRYLDELALCGGQTLVLHEATIGGSTMAQHFEKAQVHERDPKSPQGLYTTKRSLKQELLAEPWDVITMQQRSFSSHDAATYRPSAQLLHDYIKKYAPRAEVVFHQTWAYRSDDPRFAESMPTPGEPRTQREMYEGLTKAYDDVAAELGLRVIPVGDAFYAADTDETWGFRPKSPVGARAYAYPDVPEQARSLHVGWRWTTSEGKRKLGMDGHHANTAGEYLGACVFYEFLFGDDVRENPYVPAGLDSAHAEFLRATAHAAIERRRAVAASSQ